MKDELRYFNQNECEIIIKLRTERINLNDYVYYIKKMKQVNVNIVLVKKIK